MKPIFWVALGVLATGLTVQGPATAAIRPAVIELFTSEGCSSCPPAEVYTAELARRPDVLALTFHVDYWDNLGWRDRFASSQATHRQRTYAEALNLRSVFTPQTIIDGKTSFVGSDRGAIGGALIARREGPRIALTQHDGIIDVAIPAYPSVAASDVLLVAFRRSAVTAIGRGENAGRTIEEANIVRVLRRLGGWEGKAVEFRQAIDSLTPDSTDVAVLIQEKGSGSIVGAGTMILRPGAAAD